MEWVGRRISLAPLPPTINADYAPVYVLVVRVSARTAEAPGFSRKGSLEEYHGLAVVADASPLP